jgi:hypothetical protein
MLEEEHFQRILNHMAENERRTGMALPPSVTLADVREGETFRDAQERILGRKFLEVFYGLRRDILGDQEDNFQANFEQSNGVGWSAEGEWLKYEEEVTKRKE